MECDSTGVFTIPEVGNAIRCIQSGSSIGQAAIPQNTRKPWRMPWNFFTRTTDMSDSVTTMVERTEAHGKPDASSGQRGGCSLDGMVRCVCGSTLFRRCYRTGGWWKQIVESNKNGGVSVVDTDVDSVRNSREPKTMECCGCGKRVANPDASTKKLTDCEPEAPRLNSETNL